MNLLVDTNIVIYHAKGDKQLSDYLRGNHIYLSFITEMELLSYPKMTAQEEVNLSEYIADTTVIGFTDQLKNELLNCEEIMG